MMFVCFKHQPKPAAVLLEICKARFNKRARLLQRDFPPVKEKMPNVRIRPKFVNQQNIFQLARLES
jgi:hypothetical protein